MVRSVWKRISAIALFTFLAAVLSIFLIVPFSETVNADEERFRCVWANGSVSEETYASFCRDFVPNEEGALRLSRGNLCGEIAFTEAYSTAYQTLKTGSLAELLALSLKGVNRIEQFVLWRLTRGCIWYSAGYFVWEGSCIKEVDFAEGEQLILLSGGITAAQLVRTGVRHLELRGEAEINSQTLIGTQVESITARPPYRVEGGAVYLDAGTAVRLVTVIPTVTSLVVSGNDFADEGALLAAQRLQSLTLPFAGSAAERGHFYYGEVAYLFSNGKEYYVPPSLKHVRITGGILVSHAFYRMVTVERIDLRGMDAQAIAPDSLVDCTALQFVRSPRADLKLSGNFTSFTASWGILFGRTE